MNQEIIILILRSAIDIFLVTSILYLTLNFLVKSQKYTMIIVTILLFVTTYFLSNFFKLTTLNSLLTGIYSWGFMIIIVVFQNEIKDGLEKLGKISSFKDFNKASEFHFVDELSEAVYEMASKKTGAIITIKRTTS
ncbi:MAG: hypothetical protein ACRC5R_01200, partial [Mycoplasmatales bacterium]